MAKPPETLLKPGRYYHQPVVADYVPTDKDGKKVYPGDPNLGTSESGYPVVPPPEVAVGPIAYPGEAKAYKTLLSPLSNAEVEKQLPGQTVGVGQAKTYPLRAAPLIPIPSKDYKFIPPSERDLPGVPSLMAGPDLTNAGKAPEEEEGAIASPAGIPKSKVKVTSDEINAAFPGDYLPAKGLETPDGPDYGVDLGETRMRMRELRYDREVREKVNELGRPLTDAEANELGTKVADDVEKHLREHIESAQGFDVMWIDSTTDNLAEEMSARHKDLQDEYGKLASVPYGLYAAARAWLNPETHIEYVPGEDLDSQDNRQRGFWDTLNWLGQGSLSTLATTAYKYGLGSKEQLEAIQRGEQGADSIAPVLEYLGTLKPEDSPMAVLTNWVAGDTILRTLGILDDSNQETVYKFLSIPYAMGLALVDPDVLTLATFGVGKVFKVGKAGLNAFRAVSQGAKVAEAAASLGKGVENGWAAAKVTADSLDEAATTFGQTVDTLQRTDGLLADATGAMTGDAVLLDAFGLALKKIADTNPMAAKAIEWYVAAHSKSSRAVTAALGTNITAARAASKRLNALVGTGITPDDANLAKVATRGTTTKLVVDLFASNPAQAATTVQNALVRAVGATNQTMQKTAAVIKAVQSSYIAHKLAEGHTKHYLDLVEFTSNNVVKAANAAPSALTPATALVRFNSAAEDLKKARETYVRVATPAARQALEAAQSTMSAVSREIGEAQVSGFGAALQAQMKRHADAAEAAKNSLAGVEMYLNMNGRRGILDSEAFTKLINKVALQSRLQDRQSTQLQVIRKAFKDVAESYRALSTDIYSGVKLRDVTAPGAAMAKSLQMRQELVNFGHTAVGRMWLSVADSVENTARLGRSTLGQSSDAVLQAGKGAIDSSRSSLDEVTRLVSGANDMPEAVQKVFSYMDDGAASLDLRFGAKTVMNLTPVGVKSLWSYGWDAMKALRKAKSIDVDSPMIQGLARAFAPTGKEGMTHVRALQQWVFDALVVGDRIKETQDEIVALIAAGKAVPKATRDSLQKLRDLDKATENLSTFSEVLKLKTATEFGVGIDTINKFEALRGVVFASQAVSNAAFLQRAAANIRGTLNGIRPEAIVTAAQLTSGLEHRTGKAFVDAFEVFSSMQLPPKLREQVLAEGKAISNGLIRLRDAGDIDAILPRSIMAELDSKLTGLIKTTDEFSARSALPEHLLGTQSLNKLLSLWRTSITSGTFLPRPHHFVNMFFGNFSQIWAQAGLTAAAKVGADQALMVARQATNTRLFQRIFGNYNNQAASRVGAALGSMSEALISTHVAGFYDVLRYPANARVTDLNGKVWEWGELRELVKREGVMQSFMTAAVREVTARGAFDGWSKNYRSLREVLGGELWKDLADTLEVRQRVSLFLHLTLNKGLRPEVAGKVTRDSLYDWGHAMAPVESGFLARMGLFWRFRKLMLRQGAEILLAPFNAAMDSKNLLSMSGYVDSSAPLRRVRSMITTVQQTARAFESAGGEDNPTTSREVWDEHLRQVYPWWTGKSAHPVLLNVPMDEPSRLWARATGEDVTHVAYTMPALTPMESVAAGISFGHVLTAFTFGDMSSKQLMGKAIEGAAGFFGPVTSQALSGFGAHLLGKTQIEPAGVKASPYEDLVMGALGREPTELRDTSSRKKEDQGKLILKDPGKTVIDQATAMMFRNLPAVGNEMKAWVDPIASEPWVYKDLGSTIAFVLGQWTGLGRAYTHNPALSLAYASEIGLKESVSDFNRASNTYKVSDLDREGTKVRYAMDEFEAAMKSEEQP